MPESKGDNGSLFSTGMLEVLGLSEDKDLAFHAGGASKIEPDPIAALRKRFGICPFSVLDARRWQPRKRIWVKNLGYEHGLLGMRSEAGREHIETAKNIVSEAWTPGSGTRAEIDEDFYKDNPHRVDGHGLSEGQGRINKAMARYADQKKHQTFKDEGDPEQGAGLCDRLAPPVPGQGMHHSENAIRENINVYADRRRAAKRAELPGERGYTAAGEQNKDLSEEDQRALGAYFAPNGSTVARGGAGGHSVGQFSDSSNRIAGGYHEDDGTPKGITGTSVFDPVLCECVYRWFLPRTGGRVLDPFAGGSVRGLVAAMLGHQYVGIEFRPGQVDANNAQADYVMEYKRDLRGGEMKRPKWIVGDALDLPDILDNDFDEYDKKYDLVFACPPYFNLEVYSVDQKDGSAFESYDKFMIWFQKIFRQAVSRLLPNRFVAIVVGDIRDEDGYYRCFEPDTVSAIRGSSKWLRAEADIVESAKGLGLKLYNRAVLVTAVGSLPVRIASQFPKSRKLGNTHQMLYVFYNGDDARDIPKELGILDGSEYGNEIEMRAELAHEEFTEKQESDEGME